MPLGLVPLKAANVVPYGPAGAGAGQSVAGEAVGEVGGLVGAALPESGVAGRPAGRAVVEGRRDVADGVVAADVGHHDHLLAGRADEQDVDVADVVVSEGRSACTVTLVVVPVSPEIVIGEG